MDNAEKIQRVENTLAEITIPATFDNVNRMLGIYQTLEQVKADLVEKAGVNDERTDNT